MPTFLVPVVAFLSANPWLIPLLIQLCLGLVGEAVKWFYSSSNPRVHAAAAFLSTVGIGPQALLNAIVGLWNGKFPQAKLPVPVAEVKQPVVPGPM